MIHLNSCQSRLSGVHLVLLVFRDIWPSNIRKILVYTGMLPYLAPSWPQIKQIRISFRSRSDLVPISF